MLFRYLIIGLMSAFLVLSIAAADVGDTLWTTLYGTSFADYPTSIAQTSDGGYLITGWTLFWTGNDKNVYLVKTDSLGDTLWERTYRWSMDDVATSVQATSDGGAIMAGWTNSRGAGGTDVLVIKTNSDGDTAWTKTYGGVYEDTAYCIRQTADGGYIVCGVTYFDDGGGGSFQNYWFKLNASGTRQWGYCSGGGYGAAANCIIPVTGGYIFTGWMKNSSGTSFVHAEKIDTSGQNIWTQSYSQIPNSMGNCIIPSADGQYIICGNVTPQGGSQQALLMKINTSGDIVWNYNYGDTDIESGSNVRQTLDNGFLISGNKKPALIPDSSKFYLVKTSAAGTFAWEKTYAFGSYNDGVCALVTSDSNFTFVGATNWRDTLNGDICLAKIQGYTINDIKNDLPLPISPEIKLSNYPNPFNSQTIIKFNLHETSPIKLQVFDILGRRVADLLDCVLPAGYHEIEWNGINQSAGIYYCILKSGYESKSIKLLLLK
jgi:hypothetical protein